MLDEGSGTMEKKLPLRQSPAQPKNNGVISEKKSDYVSNKNGRPRKYKQPNNGGRSQELSQNSKPLQKYTQPYSDKRPRQRGYFNDRQGEEVVEVHDELFVADDTNSRKGSANYLLKFSFTPRGENGQYLPGRGYGGRFSRSGYWPRRRTVTPRYSPEQFLQASCQFIVTEGGEYAEQSINPDALVNWDMVEQVRTFSVEPVVCPICLQKLSAGKITKCGHVYCWSCILHHLKEKKDMCRKLECPICPHRIDPEELRSVLCVETTEYKVGDTIEMKLMRKSKGSVYVCPKSEWKDRGGILHNINDGTITQYMKLLSATNDQIQEYIINREKQDLDQLIQEAEGYETSFIDDAKTSLEERENRLKAKRSLTTVQKDEPLVCKVLNQEPEAAVTAKAKFDNADEDEITVKYTDAFEDVEEQSYISSSELETSGLSESVCDDVFQSTTTVSEASSQDSLEDTAGSYPSSPALTLPLMNQQFDTSGHLTPEEAADHLELPEGGGGSFSLQRNSTRNKDTYYFYQASTGQHIYLHSLNAQCLTREYGSLENSPEVIEAKIVAIERIFMTEDVRKRLRYLNHIPLTCEFHVVELKFQPPLLSRETLLHFQPEFDKRHRVRAKKKKEDKERAKQQEVEHKASFGIYPEVQIPLDNLTQFPAHLGNLSSTSSPVLIGGTRQNDLGSVRNNSWSESNSDTSSMSLGSIGGPRQRNDSEESQAGSMSFAQMLKAGKSTPQNAAWGRAAPQENSLHVSATMPELRSPSGRWRGDDDDEDDGGDSLPAPSIASSWLDGLSKLDDARDRRLAQEGAASTNGASDATGGKKKKKRKEKQLLFSTSMVRKS